MPEHEQKQEEFSLKNYFVPLTNLKAVHFIIIIGLIVFFNGLFNGFVGDDQLQVTDSSSIQSVANIPSFFSESTFYNGASNELFGAYYKPILISIYTVIYSLFGANPTVFHLIQVILFIVNACILFVVLEKFFNRNTAFILSIIFLLHPINSENAFYIADMQEVLFFFFGIVGFYIIQNYRSSRALLLSSIFLFFSLLSKETGLLFSVITIIYTYIYNRKSIYKSLGYIGVMLFLYSILRIHAIGLFSPSEISAPIQKLTLLNRALNMPEIFLFYLKTFIFPYNLSVSYQWIITKITFSLFILPLIIDSLFILLIIFWGIKIYKKSIKYFKLYTFFALWFFLGILFHLQIFPLDQTVADRWFYFPIVGLLGMIGTLSEVYKLNLKHIITIFFIVVIVILLSIVTFTRSFDWRNNFTLSYHDIKNSNSFDLDVVLSTEYLEMDKYNQAEMYAEKSVKLFPNMINYTNLGSVLNTMHKYKEAKMAYMNALHYGDFYLTYENLAVLALHYGDQKTNIHFIKYISLRKYPRDGKIWLCLALLEYEQGNKENARKEITNAYILSKTNLISSAYYTIMNNQPVIK